MSHPLSSQPKRGGNAAIYAPPCHHESHHNLSQNSRHFTHDAPDAGFLLSPLLGQAVPVAEYVTSATRSAPAHYMGNISMEVRCILEDTVAHHASLHTHYISIEICSNSNSDASFASRPHAYIHEQWLSPRCGCRREDRILARDICTRHHVPTRKLSTAQIRADMAGIYSSAPHKSDHDDDPGP